MKNLRFKSLIATAALLAIAGSAQAALYSNDYGSLVPGYAPNDDGFFGPVALPFAVNFFGTTYNSIHVANNGNVTFGGGTSVFTPSPLNTQATLPMIAPFWTDLDSRSDPLGSIAPVTGGSGVYLNQTSPQQVVVTWDRLGYFAENYTGRALFQLVLNDPSATPAGEAAIGFFYGEISSGSNDDDVTAGFGDGLGGVAPGEIALFSGTSASAARTLGGQQYWYTLEGGTPRDVNDTPEPATLGLLGLGFAGLLARRRQSR